MRFGCASSSAFADNARNVFCHEAQEVALRAAAPAEGTGLVRFKLTAAVPASVAILIVVLASAWQRFIQCMDSIRKATKTARP
jgi:hypothetical protein